jgi:hypothetical protein
LILPPSTVSMPTRYNYHSSDSSKQKATKVQKRRDSAKGATNNAVLTTPLVTRPAGISSPEKSPTGPERMEIDRPALSEDGQEALQAGKNRGEDDLAAQYEMVESMSWISETSYGTNGALRCENGK